MNTTIENQVVYTKSAARRARIAAQMTYQQMTQYSGLNERVIRDFESMTYNKNNKYVAKLHQEAIDKFLFDRHNDKVKMTIEDSEALRATMLEMIKQKLDSSNLEYLLKVAKKMGMDI